MFRKRRQADQQAWEAWQWIAQQHSRNRPLSQSSWRHPLELVGQVTHVYMLARTAPKRSSTSAPPAAGTPGGPTTGPGPASGSQSTAGYRHHRGPTPDAKCAGSTTGTPPGHPTPPSEHSDTTAGFAKPSAETLRLPRPHRDNQTLCT